MPHYSLNICFMRLRSTFITTPIEEVLVQGISVADGLRPLGIEAYPALEFILSSLFLRMTGFSEQKLRSIHWEIATQNLDVRYSMLKGDEGKYGEYSSYEKKKDFYDFLKQQSLKLCNNELKWTTDERKSIVEYSQNVVEKVLQESVFSISYSNKLKSSLDFVKQWTQDDILNNCFLSQRLVNIYTEYLYKQRNNSAHNTLSYQQDYISLTELRKPESDTHTYFTYFAILILLDTIFIKSYKKIITSLKLIF